MPRPRGPRAAQSNRPRGQHAPSSSSDRASVKAPRTELLGLPDRRERLAVADAGGDALYDPLPEPAGLEPFAETLDEGQHVRVQLAAEVGDGNNVREIGQRVGASAPLGDLAAYALPDDGLALGIAGADRRWDRTTSRRAPRTSGWPPRVFGRVRRAAR